ncbi:peptidylprolyl isomerase [Rhodococcus sp. 05-2256-B2]|uniref:peptidylprolyl isomerase n=1 Tax=unclassified Rhodococcus (in: high G+C Gram-positive bacteria) TaxID=192944 RepID=UPI000B9B5BDC|nr:MULTISPECIES: peptidylprolyl isomerase [unclassified Rhodococcus (in: high G+C Gram-positive bacteria)]OZD88837.1 peptidylprolyl isomerase [Rhodococcus sp. 05-2256-B4]OZD91917.1 peptidylprolyl isomerase [Rhodococcus sp. 05-2256-B2]OZD95249.1 peptidylprolyl isomerase [Rhodococcus sp. 05-2256-B3]OZE02403.1 peptidylprolyl isomerase [Rhodococcus sp. 05-2256-B1]
MPSNEQRREAAKRKLERQLVRRAERARRRKQLTIAGSILGVVAVVAVVSVVFVVTRGDDDASTAQDSTTSAPADSIIAAGRTEPLPETVNCSYPAAEQPAAKPNTPPRTENIPTSDEPLSYSMATTAGNIGLTLNNPESPCTVNSFVSLANQGYFDGTTCHRLTTGAGLQVLQCGDPTGSGSGGPGYQFADEFPTDTYAEGDPAAQTPVLYPRGTLAMANAGPGTNGSQFFLVYGDSQLPPAYTAFGTIDETGLATLDAIAAKGAQGGASDGAPAEPVDITSMQSDL